MSRLPHPPRVMNSPAARMMTYDSQNYVTGYVDPTMRSIPLTAFVCDGVDLAAVSAQSAALFVVCGSPLSPSDLCDGPVRPREEEA